MSYDHRKRTFTPGQALGLCKPTTNKSLPFNKERRMRTSSRKGKRSKRYVEQMMLCVRVSCTSVLALKQSSKVFERLYISNLCLTVSLSCRCLNYPVISARVCCVDPAGKFVLHYNCLPDEGLSKYKRNRMG